MLYEVITVCESCREVGVSEKTFYRWRKAMAEVQTEEQIEKVTHLNAIKWFRFDDMFANYKREEITVGALHAKARAKGVDTAPKSSGGAAPLTEDRPVTSGDILGMFQAHAERRAKEMESV